MTEKRGCLWLTGQPTDVPGVCSRAFNTQMCKAWGRRSSETPGNVCLLVRHQAQISGLLWRDPAGAMEA